ncbi:YkgJ family cysteine cluster protein [Aliiglaciecola aliphaticivorans]
MSDQNLQYGAANQAAQSNFNKLSDSMPRKLVEKEAKITKRLSKAKIPTSKKLRKLYELMEELAVHIGKFTPCSKGCNHCCNYPVTISNIEIKNIETGTGIQRKPLIVMQERHNFTPCPFLKDGACSIYDVRPFVCRRHVTMTETNEWCKPEHAFDYSFPLLTFTEINKSYDLIRVESGEPSLIDIRDAF